MQQGWNTKILTLTLRNSVLQSGLLGAPMVPSTLIYEITFQRFDEKETLSYYKT